MNKIRKIWIGTSIKNDSMSWEVGQKVRLNREGSEFGTVHGIEKTGSGYDVLVKQGNIVKTWKSTSMDVTIEYDLAF